METMVKQTFIIIDLLDYIRALMQPVTMHPMITSVQQTLEHVQSQSVYT